jgi:hypothetical protein
MNQAELNSMPYEKGIDHDESDQDRQSQYPEQRRADRHIAIPTIQLIGCQFTITGSAGSISHAEV